MAGYKLNLKANNLMFFIQMASSVDEDIWLYHLHRHDYSNWFKFSVKDLELSERSRAIEMDENNPVSSRKEIFKLILNKYTTPNWIST